MFRLRTPVLARAGPTDPDVLAQQISIQCDLVPGSKEHAANAGFLNVGVYVKSNQLGKERKGMGILPGQSPK